MDFRWFSKFLSSLLLATYATSVMASDKLSVVAEPLIQDDRQLEYLYPAVLDGSESTANDGLKKFTVFLEIMNSEGTKAISHCTGIILDEDIILSAGHCLKDDTLKVRVNYGLGGRYGFTHKVMALGYRSYYPVRPTDGKSHFNSGYLAFDEQNRARYESEVVNRKAFFNFANQNIIAKEEFRDIAVIRVPKIPKGYQKVTRFSGDLSFRQKVIMAGYGTNSRQDDKNVRQLRWSEGELVGHYTFNNEYTMGYQIYSPTRQQACFGDSGGPLFVQSQKGVFQLLAVNSFVFNNCANANWYMNPNYYFNLINDAIKVLRQTVFT